MIRKARAVFAAAAVLFVLASATAVWRAWPAASVAGRAVYNRLRYGVETFYSPADRDGDGLADNVDVMLSARRYVAERPAYDSDYYAGGYPPEGRGVCADVIWQALKGAGYDFKDMIDRDIALSPGSYPLPETGQDRNIDFRRVVNIMAYCARHCRTLTLDAEDAAAWQPGDFVFYAGHVAVISDRRNAKGVPFIIHHAGGGAAEEDALTEREITGHYRWNGE